MDSKTKSPLLFVGAVVVGAGLFYGGFLMGQRTGPQFHQDGTVTVQKGDSVIGTVLGTITAKDADSLTLEIRMGLTKRVLIDHATILRTAEGATTTLASFMPGAKVIAVGVVQPDESLWASKVDMTPLPAAAGPIRH